MPNPFAHIELSTDDVKKAKKFYASVFAWKLNDLPAMSYTMVDVGGGVGGGMQKKQMPEQPTAWLPYVQVDDVKVTMAKAVKAGASVALEFQEVGEMGSIGIFIDPAGAALGVWAAKPGGEAHAAPPPPPAATKAAKKAPAKKAAPEAVAPVKKAAAPAAAPAKKSAAPAKKAPAAAKKAAAPAAAPAKKEPAKKVPPPPAAPVKKAPAKKR